MARKGKAPRARKKADPIYNARRRYRRQAERFMEKAEQAVGAAKSRLTQLARDAIENAMRTYEDKSKVQGRVKAVAEKLGVSRPETVDTARIAELVQESKQALASAPIDRTAEAKKILSRDNIGARFYGGLSFIWEGIPHGERNQAILDYFGVDSLMDVLEFFENQGINLYETDATMEIDSSQSAVNRMIMMQITNEGLSFTRVHND